MVSTTDIITIETAALRVDTLPAYGARVVGLIDKATGRDWMAPGGSSANVGEDAVYGIDEAVGWDECFPTVGVWDASGTGWKRTLRDHGDLWGRPWQVDDVSPTRLTTSYAGREFTFRRILSVEGSTLTAEYEVKNTGSAELPYLWAMHCLLTATPGDRFVLDGLSQLDAGYLVLNGRRFEPGKLPWPGPSSMFPVPLDLLHENASAIAAKLYASAIPSRSVAVGRGDDWLVIGWDASLNDLGVWMTYGGWPGPGGAQQIAPEPTSAPADDLGDALQQGTAVHLAPGATRRWTVELSLSKQPRAADRAKTASEGARP